MRRENQVDIIVVYWINLVQLLFWASEIYRLIIIQGGPVKDLYPKYRAQVISHF